MGKLNPGWGWGSEPRIWGLARARHARGPRVVSNSGAVAVPPPPPLMGHQVHKPIHDPYLTHAGQLNRTCLGAQLGTSGLTPCTWGHCAAIGRPKAPGEPRTTPQGSAPKAQLSPHRIWKVLAAGRHLTLPVSPDPWPAGSHHAGLHAAPPAAAQHAPPRPPLLLPRSQLPRPGPSPPTQRPLPPTPGPRCPGPWLTPQ